MSRNKNSMTIYDIAEVTGFSPKTVSRVINKKSNVKKETAEIINAAIKKYNFVPNRYAKNLKYKQDKIVLISVKTSKVFPMKWLQILLEKIGLKCSEENVTLITEYFYSEEDFKNTVVNSVGSLIDAALLFYESENDIRIKLLNDHNIPFIVFGKSCTKDVVYVTNDDYNSLVDLFDTLCIDGIKSSLLLLSGKSPVNLERVKGVQDSYKKNGLNLDDLRVQYGLRTISDVYQFIHEKINRTNLPDVIFVSGDERVPGVYKALHEKGITIPDDVVVVGFDNIPTSSYFIPSLTTIQPNYEQLAIEVVDRINKIIDKQLVKSIEIPTKLILRDSTKQISKNSR